MIVNIRSSKKTQFIWKLRKQSIENFPSLASPDELQQFELILSMIAVDALYSGEIEYISDESSSNDITDENEKITTDNLSHVGKLFSNHVVSIGIYRN